VANRTEIVCLCEGAEGSSIDTVFINTLMNALKPAWIRPVNKRPARPVACGNRSAVIKRTPDELKACLQRGSHTTLMVWADCDHDCADGDALKKEFWNEAERAGIAKNDFEQIVFVFAKDRLENWIEFLNTGKTDETQEGPRVRDNRTVANAATKLADMCHRQTDEDMPPSLQWSCNNWRSLVRRMG